jgi:cell fate regulator YaaT (PSP1 superfamily)
MGACSTCSLNKETEEGGCKNGGCLTGGCNKLNVFNWLSDMDNQANNRFDVVEVRFKNGRKSFYRNKTNLDLHTGDSVVIDVPNGHHIGYVSLQGELVRLQMNKKKVNNDELVRQIYRIASSHDLEKYEKVQNRENSTLYRSREIIQQMGLKMKLTDVEYQADNAKATFYYSADERVDFRELIKVLASEFKIRVEMRQISLRQEAGRMGGIGSCGRELCCSTWLTDFKSVTTSAARYQNLSLNPSKLSGQCGRLKCCLNYELDTYMTALEDIPKVDKPLKTEKGEAYLQKTDIFRKVMWFGFTGESMWQPISTERVAEIIALNEEGKKPENLQVDQDLEKLEKARAVTNDLERLDRKYKPGKSKRRKPRNKKRRYFGGPSNKNK